jgi:hypothetical protein
LKKDKAKRLGRSYSLILSHRINRLGRFDPILSTAII